MGSEPEARDDFPLSERCPAPEPARRKWAEVALGLIARDTGSLVGEQFFRSLARNLAAALRVRWAFIGTLVEGEGTRVRLLVFWTGHGFSEPFEYPTKGTPCEQVMAQSLQYFPDNVQALFPEDAWLKEQRVVSYLAIPLFDSAGRPLGHMGVMDDQPMDPAIPMEAVLRVFAARAGAEIERQHAEEALRASEERYRDLIENAHDLVQSIASDGRILFANRAWLETLGYCAQDVPAINLFQIVHPNTLTEFRRLLDRVFAGEQSIFAQTEFVAKDGREVLVEGSVTGRVESGRVVAAQAIFRNTTERREWEARLDRATRHDSLTDLPNRVVFVDRLNQALVRVRARRTPRPLAVLMLDLDRFKLVNETLGHASGDRLLLSVAQRLSSCLREGDTVARLGGDEFAILLPEIDKASDMVIVVEKLFAAIRPPVVLDGHEVFATMSIGISIAPDDGEEAGIVLKNADAAMYRAKDQGRNTYQLYSPAMNVSTLERLSLESSLRHALERDEFLVYFQPQVEVRTRRIIGVEALVRWLHPEWGLVSPARFIPLAEETGLIVPIGERVLRAACAQNRRWQDQGIPPFPVSVNISARQFQQPDLNALIARVLGETNLDPRWLELELTESLLMANAEQTISALKTLHEMGIGLAIDDFGVGYSSLSYLKRFPIDTIKIDQSFVRHITSDADDAAIATAIIAMAHSLNLTVVAEGVETGEQSAFLERQQCDAIQGYLISPPRPAHEITPLLCAKRDRRESPPISPVGRVA